MEEKHVGECLYCFPLGTLNATGYANFSIVELDRGFVINTAELFAWTIAFDTRLIRWNVNRSFWSGRPLPPLESKIQNKTYFYLML